MGNYALWGVLVSMCIMSLLFVLDYDYVDLDEIVFCVSVFFAVISLVLGINGVILARTFRAIIGIILSSLLIIFYLLVLYLLQNICVIC